MAAESLPVHVVLTPGQSDLLTIIGGFALTLALAAFVGYFGRRGPSV